MKNKFCARSKAYIIFLGNEGEEMKSYWYASKTERDEEFNRWKEEGYIILPTEYLLPPERREEKKVYGSEAGRCSFMRMAIPLNRYKTLKDE